MPLFLYFWGGLHCKYGANIQNFCNIQNFYSDFMDLFERILSKEEINHRFIIAVNAVIANGLISSKTGLAESLGVKPAKFSEILNNRMKAGVDMIAIMCDFYKVSPDWLLMSRGNSIFRQDTTLPQIWVDDENLNNKYPKDKENSGASDIQNASYNNIPIAPFLELIRDKDSTIKDQAEEIGQLKERIAQLERDMQKNASDAAASNIANVG